MLCFCLFLGVCIITSIKFGGFSRSEGTVSSLPTAVPYQNTKSTSIRLQIGRHWSIPHLERWGGWILQDHYQLCMSERRGWGGCMHVMAAIRASTSPPLNMTEHATSVKPQLTPPSRKSNFNNQNHKCVWWINSKSKSAASGDYTLERQVFASGGWNIGDGM